MQKLKITNLPRWISEIHLKQFFNSCGKIVHASIAFDENTLKPLCHGFMVFADDESMNKALAKNNTLLDGFIIEVQIDQGVEEPLVDNTIVEAT